MSGAIKQSTMSRQPVKHKACDIGRDQPNSREKMHDFTAEFLKCVKFHGKFTERILQIHGPHRRYFEVLRYCKQRNFRTTNIYYTISQNSRQSMSTT